MSTDWTKSSLASIFSVSSSMETLSSSTVHMIVSFLMPNASGTSLPGSQRRGGESRNVRNDNNEVRTTMPCGFRLIHRMERPEMVCIVQRKIIYCLTTLSTEQLKNGACHASIYDLNTYLLPKGGHPSRSCGLLPREPSCRSRRPRV